VGLVSNVAEAAAGGLLRVAARLDGELATRFSKPVAFTARPRVSGLTLGKDKTGWRNSAVALRCIETIASNAGSVRLRVIDATGAEVDHPLTQLWSQPNPMMSAEVFARILWWRMERKGQCHIYVDRGEEGTGPPQALVPLFGTCQPVVEDGEHIGWKYTPPGGRAVGLLPEEVLWLRYPDPDDEWSVIAPMEGALDALEMDAYAREWQRGEFKNGSRPSGVVYLGSVSQETHDSVVAQIKARAEGSKNAGRNIVLSSELGAEGTAPMPKYERFGMTAQEMAYLDSRRQNAEETMLAFGMPKDYLLGGATYENREASRNTLWVDTINGKLALLAGEITRQMVPEPGLRAEFDTSDVDALQESADKRAQRTVLVHGSDVTTINEARAELGMDELPEPIGSMTQTAYREMVRAAATVAALGLDGGANRTALWLPGAPLALPATRTTLGYDATQKHYDRHERVIVKAVVRLSGRQEQVVLTNLERVMGDRTKRGRAWKTQTIEAADIWRMGQDHDAELALRAQVEDLFDDGYWRELTRQATEDSVEGAWVDGATVTADSLGLSFDVFEDSVLAGMGARNEQLADMVTATTKEVLESRVLLEGVAAGESVDQLAARVRGVFHELSTYRAKTIARTETVGGFNAASHTVAHAAGGVERRRWLATGDKRTRATHMALHGTEVEGFDTRYDNGCLYPGDPSGPPKEVIQCRCVEEFILD
jgi:HK97 family phage portal protein